MPIQAVPWNNKIMIMYQWCNLYWLTNAFDLEKVKPSIQNSLAFGEVLALFLKNRVVSISDQRFILYFTNTSMKAVSTLKFHQEVALFSLNI